MYATKVCWNANRLVNNRIAKLWELCEADQGGPPDRLMHATPPG